MKAEDIFLGIAIICLVFSVALLVSVITGDVEYVFDSYEQNITDVYHIEAPFGYLHVDIGGGFLYIKSKPGESYIVKYWEGNELKTLSLDAHDENVHLIVGEYDDIIVRIERYKVRWEFFGSIYLKFPTYEMHYYIYSPEVPELNVTVSGEW